MTEAHTALATPVAAAAAAEPAPLRHSICMISDFFYPRLGGVEMHIWSLSQCLLALGHKVVVVTHAYGQRRGVRFMSNGLKVYYLPLVPFVDQSTFPSFFGIFPLLRHILVRERINIVHVHQATSCLGHESLLSSRAMGYKVVYTDHSLFGFNDAASINVNKLMKLSMSDVDHAICVSHTCRENLVLRASIPPHRTSAIPNAVDPFRFTPDPSARRPKGTINVVMVSRLVYRKGVDLVVDVIPAICARFPNVHFIIGGDGPKKLLLEEMREKHQLHERVELLGAVPHRLVRDTLVRGHIFLNCSLTESFCIAILEAACCGLFAVSTRVGGVPEVLPNRMIKFAEPTVESLTEALAAAIPLAESVDPYEFHESIRRMYSWHDVAVRTAVVYDRCMRTPSVSLLERLRRIASTGTIFGLVTLALVSLQFLFWRILEWIVPTDTIELAPQMPYFVADTHAGAHTTRALDDEAEDRRRTAPAAAPPATTSAPGAPEFPATNTTPGDVRPRATRSPPVVLSEDWAAGLVPPPGVRPGELPPLSLDAADASDASSPPPRFPVPPLPPSDSEDDEDDDPRGGAGAAHTAATEGGASGAGAVESGGRRDGGKPPRRPLVR